MCVVDGTGGVCTTAEISGETGDIGTSALLAALLLRGNELERLRPPVFVRDSCFIWVTDATSGDSAAAAAAAAALLTNTHESLFSQ